jgi:hypothetical protein
MTRKVCEKEDCLDFDDNCPLHCSLNEACSHVADDLYRAPDAPVESKD